MKNAQTVSKLQKNLGELVGRLIDGGHELGVQVAVYWEGEPVVDIAAGTLSPGSGRPVDRDTLFPTCSTSKGLASTLLHVLAARGLLDYDRPVAGYWPEYGCRGKEKTTVRQALAHMAGIPRLPKFDSCEEVADWERSSRRIAALAPEWEPGSAMQYHGWTWGWLAGKVAEGAGGKPFGTLFRELVAEPLGLEKTMYFGTDDEAESRVSPFVPQPTSKEQISTTREVHETGAKIAVPGPIMDFVNRPDLRRGCLPSIGCLTSAEAIARMYAGVVGVVDGTRLLPDTVLDEATAVQTRPYEVPRCFGHGMGLGYALKGTEKFPGSFFGHGGAGGSEGMVNRPLRLSVGVTKNRFDTHENAPGHTNVLVVEAILDLVGREGDGGFFGGW